MKRKIILLLVILQSYSVSAQEVNGKVFSEIENEPLSNVAVENLNSGITVFTDNSGNFRISASEFPLQLKFSLLGYRQKTISIQGPEMELQVFLKQEIGQLSEVILRSSNIPQNIRKTPAAVSLLSENELSRKDNFNLVQSFNYVPGVYVNQGALNTNKINIRGIGSRAQYSTNRIKAYINGIPLTTAEGELTLDDFDPELLERVEIFKGPVSSLYGAGLGGSINLYTERSPGEERSITTDFNYGSFNTRKSRINVSYAKDSLNFSLNYNNIQSDGYRQNGAYDRISVTGNTGYLNKSGNYWAAFFAYTNLKAFIPSSLNEKDFINDPRSAAFTWFNAAGYESYSRNVIGLSYDHNFSKTWKNQTSIFYNSRDGYEPRPFDILDDDNESLGIRSRFNHNTSMFKIPAEFSFGGEGVLEWYETGTFKNLYEEAETRRSIQGDRLSLNNQQRNYVNFFGQMNLELTPKLLFETGFNFNSTAYELEDNYEEDGIDQSGKYTFDPVFSPRAGLSFEAFEGKTFYTSISHGFSTPTVAETLTPEGLINTDLKTEKGWNYEIGFKGNWLTNKLYTELNLYTIQIQDLLVARRVGQDQYVGVNAGKSSHNGIEFTSVYQDYIFEDLNIKGFLNANFNFFEFDEFVDLGEDYSGKEIPGTPGYMLSPGVELQYERLTANLNYQAFGKIALDDENSAYTDPYGLLNFKMDYDWKISRHFDLIFNFGINNLLDEHYAASVVTNAVGFGGAAPRYYYPGNPRNYFGGVRLKYSLD